MEVKMIHDLVAEKVMKWRLEKVADKEGAEVEYWIIDNEGNKIRREEFVPTESYDQAFLVVDKIKEMDFGIELYMEKFFPVEVSVYYDEWKYEEFDFKSGEVIQMNIDVRVAICLAALKLVGIHVDI